MYTPRKAGTPGQRRDSNYPTPGRNSPPSPTPLTNRQTRRRIGIPFVRTRIHPLFLIPVFLVGAYFSPFKGPPELVYTGPAYQDHYGDATYLPPDAPPLAADGEEELGVKRARILKGKAKKVEDIKVQQQDEEEEGEYWDFSYQDDPADAPTSTPHLVERDGYLYYPTSVPLVDMVIPKAQRLRSQPAVDPLKHLGSLAPLVAPPPPPPYHPPGSAFLPKAPPKLAAAPITDPLLAAHPPPRLGGARGAPLGGGAAAPPPPVAKGRPQLPAFLQAGGKRVPGAEAVPAPAGKARAKPHKVAVIPERGPQGQILGPNAAAMAKAAREGIPFRPKKPWDLLEEEKEIERLRIKAREKEVQQEEAQMEWAPVAAAGRFAPDGGAARKEKEKEKEVVEGLFKAGAIEEEEEEEGEEEGDNGEEADMWTKVEYESAGDEDEGSLEDELDEDEDDDRAILEGLVGLSPEERKHLSPDERALLDDIEQERAEEEVQPVVKRPVVVKGVQKPARPAPRVKGGRQRAAPKNARMALVKRAAIVEPPAEDTSADSPTQPDSPPQVLPRAVSDDTPSASSPSRDRLHPIAKLVADAEEQWEDLLRRQSQTLEHAVFEYQRRYGRKPPLGFDKWWRYAMENRVVLVDEYDQINTDIEPFLALPSSEVRARALALATDRTLPTFAQSFTLTVKDGALKASGPNAKAPKSEDMQDIMSEFVQVLPDMTLTFASHGEPSIAISGEARQRHVEAARQGELLDRAKSYEVLENPGYAPFQGLCSPNSTARRSADGRPLDRAPSGPSFVSTDHAPAMDMCTHPEIQHQNGFTSWEGPRPHILYPLFSWSKTRMHGDLLCAPLDEYFAEVGRDPLWKNKKHNKVLWRGSTKGAWHDKTSNWRSSHRARLVQLTNDVEGQREVRFADSASSDSLRRFIGPTPDINEYYFDVAYANAPIQCDQGDRTCAILRKEMRFEKTMTKDEGNEYKYVLDVDGNGWSDRFHRLMASSSLVFKSTIFPEWWTQRVMPWFHYVPVKSDYSDLTDAAAFFIGAPDGTGAHDALAEKIASNGKKWAAEHWREADMAAYQFRLYLEFSRLVNRDEKGSHDFTLN